jgi:hypothetical protein
MDNNQVSFYYRHLTIRPDFHYPDGYEPHSLLDGRIAYWQSGEFGLRATSTPANVSPVFRSNSIMSYKSSEYDPRYHYNWPKPDSEYAKFSKTDDQ